MFGSGSLGEVELEISDNTLYSILEYLLSKEFYDEIALVMMARLTKGG